MALLAGIRVPDTARPRPLEACLEVARRPRDLRALGINAYRWSERSVVGLVMQTRDNSLRTFRRKGLFGRSRLTSTQGHGEPNPTRIPIGHTAMDALAVRLEEETGIRAVAGGSWGEVLETPMTAHFIGGAPIGSSPERGVLDPYHRLWGHPGISVVDGAAVSANLGVNPSLTITAQAERAMSLWPNSGDADPRPAQDEPYAVLPRVRPRTPAVPRPFPRVAADQPRDAVPGEPVGVAERR
jgi:cholesterol oxidase